MWSKNYFNKASFIIQMETSQVTFHSMRMPEQRCMISQAPRPHLRKRSAAFVFLLPPFLRTSITISDCSAARSSGLSLTAANTSAKIQRSNKTRSDSEMMAGGGTETCSAAVGWDNADGAERDRLGLSFCMILRRGRRKISGTTRSLGRSWRAEAIIGGRRN